ncbi:hypothetical protein [Neobacillus cucumis]|nr:hypothetical protein [Neobacillus cucumis]
MLKSQIALNLECREKPFCRIQLTTVEAKDAEGLVNKIIQSIYQ